MSLLRKITRKLKGCAGLWFFHRWELEVCDMRCAIYVCRNCGKRIEEWQ